MSIADYYLKARKQVDDEIMIILKERANLNIHKIFETEQFKFSLFGRNMSNTSKEEIHKVVDKLQDPMSLMKDTLRRRGYRPSEIRTTVIMLYNKYLNKTGNTNVLYEDVCDSVAKLLSEKFEIYDELDLQDLRKSKN